MKEKEWKIKTKQKPKKIGMNKYQIKIELERRKDVVCKVKYVCVYSSEIEMHSEWVRQTKSVKV